MVDHDLVKHLKAILAKAEGGEVLFYVGSATIITAHNEAVALAGSFVPAAAAALDPASRKAAYTKTLEALGASLAELTGIENPSPLVET